MSKKQKTAEGETTAVLTTVETTLAHEAEVAQKLPKGGVPWSPWVAVLYAIITFFTAQFVAGVVVYMYPLLRGQGVEGANEWLSNSVVAQFWFVLLAEALTFWALWWFIKRRGSTLRAIGWKKPRWVDPVIALAGFAGYFLIYVAIFAAVTHLFTGIDTEQKQELGFDNVVGDTNLVLTFLSLVVLPPIVEETMFRGFVYTGMRNKYKPIGAAILTSVLFAVAHLQFGNGKPLLWIAAIDTFTLSLVLCYMREKTGSLWPGIFLHALKNGIAFTSLYIIHSL